jgi:hypothetical protein
MLAFPPLVGALGKLFVRDIGTRPDLPIWGDGLVQQSLAELYSPCGWSSACADEFAFLIPSLAARFRPASTVPPEAAAYLQRLLLAHISFAAHHLPQLQQDRPRQAPRTLELILASGTITTLTAGEIVREAEAARRTFFGPLCPLAAQTTRASQTAATPQFTRECWVFELSVLSCLDHMLATARRGGKRDHHICLTDAFVGSLHASFNAAYVYPEFVYAHELLSLGAWLGYLVRGRAALMPSFVAELLRCELGVAPRESSRAGDASEIRTLLRFYADLAVGSRRLLRQARGAGKSGRAKLVRPRGQSMGQPYVWNQRVAKEIDARLQPIMRN